MWSGEWCVDRVGLDRLVPLEHCKGFILWDH